MLKPTWQHWLVYWKSAFSVIKIPALTQLDSSSKSVSDVLVILFILFSLACDLLSVLYHSDSVIFHLIYLLYEQMQLKERGKESVILRLP